MGIWYRFQLSGRIRALRALRGILELLAGEVRYGRATLPECCSHIARYLSAPFSEAFTEIGSRMEENTGISFGEAFREGMNGILEDCENFLRFTSQTGFADGKMQLQSIEHSVELLQATEEGLERENAEKCRMAVGLGAMGGLLLILVLW